MTDNDLDADDFLVDEYLVQMRVKNNLLWNAIKKAGYKTITSFSKDCKLSSSVIGQYLNFKSAPLDKNDKLKPTAKRMIKVLKLSLQDIFPEKHLRETLEKNTGESTMSFSDVSNLLASQNDPSILLENMDLEKAMSDAICTLNPREQRVINKRFGFEGTPMTLEAIANSEGIQRERVRQIEMKAIRKLRHPSRSEILKDIKYSRFKITKEQAEKEAEKERKIPLWKIGKKCSRCDSSISSGQTVCHMCIEDKNCIYDDLDEVQQYGRNQNDE